MPAITTEHNGDILVVGFTDSKILDNQRIEQVGKELQEVVSQAESKRLLLNFRGVSFMSSAMITKLVMLNKSCKKAEVALKFCEVSPNVMEVFKITKLNKLFDIQADEEKAVASFDKKVGSADFAMTHSRDNPIENLIDLERAQIGHEIHDGLLPLIFAAAAGIDSVIDQMPAGDDESRQKLEQASKWLSDALRTGRQLLADVYPPELLGSLWGRAAKDAVNRLRLDADTRVEWRIDEQAEETSKPVAMAIYRIVVEAIRNAARHGKATKIEVVAVNDADLIEVSVRDNGSGFDPAQVPDDRYGIRAMRGRAQLIGGALKVESQVGGPTSVIFSVNHQHP